MIDPRASTLRSLRRTLWGIVAFLLGFIALLLVVSRQYLFPAIAAAADADPTGKKHLAAVSALLLAILLVIIVIGLLLVLRTRRFFFQRANDRVPTAYTDAWSASADRMKTPPAEDEAAEA